MPPRLALLLVVGALLTMQTPSSVLSASASSTSGGAHTRVLTRGASDRAFHELHLGGIPNSVGLSLIGARRGATPYVLHVEGGHVIARPRLSQEPLESGSALAGLDLDLRDASSARFTIHIESVGTTQYWAGPPEAVASYTLTYTSATHSDPQPLCTASGNEALIFAGDRYDSDRKTVIATGSATDGWFNIACVGTALAKLHLTRHTEASQTVKTTAIERQAMLKMFTADICGDGTSFTVHGQPLMWADANHLTAFAHAPASLEAVWTDRGAVCLDTPRRPELTAAIASRCGPLPRCTTQHGYVISANPR